MLNIERTIEDMENVFLELGFKRGKIGEHEYLICKDNYCKISYAKEITGFVLESTNDLEEARKDLLEDAEVYPDNWPLEKILETLREDIFSIYLNR